MPDIGHLAHAKNPPKLSCPHLPPICLLSLTMGRFCCSLFFQKLRLASLIACPLLNVVDSLRPTDPVNIQKTISLNGISSCPLLSLSPSPLPCCLPDIPMVPECMTPTPTPPPRGVYYFPRTRPVECDWNWRSKVNSVHQFNEC